VRLSLRRLLRDLRLGPEEQAVARREHCLEELYDPECAPGACACGEAAEGALEAERRRWAHAGERPAAG
jgi:hypothetical protein